MTGKKLLLDRAIEHCDPRTATTLGERLKVSRQQISRWKHGHDPMPQDKVIAAAKIAHENAGDWWLLIEREQSTGEVRKSIEDIMKRLGVSFAAIALCAMATLPVPVKAAAYAVADSAHCILCKLIGLFSFGDRSGNTVWRVPGTSSTVLA